MFFQVVPAESPLPKHLDTSRNETFLKVFSNTFSDSVEHSNWTTAAITSELRVVAEATDPELSNYNSHGGNVDAAVFPCRNATAILRQHSLLNATGKASSLSHLCKNDWTVLSSSGSCFSSNAAKHQPTINRQFNAARLPSIALLIRTKCDGKVFAMVLTPYDPQKTAPPTSLAVAPSQTNQNANISLNISAIPQHHSDPADVSGLLDRDPVFRNGVRTFDVFPYGPVQKNAAMINAIDNSNASSVLDAKQRPVGICYTLTLSPVATDARHIVVSLDGRFVAVFREHDLSNANLSSGPSAPQLPLFLDTDKCLQHVTVAMSRCRSQSRQSLGRLQLLWAGASILSDRVTPVNGMQRSDVFTFSTIHSDKSVRVYTMLDENKSDSENTRFSPTEASFAGGDTICKLHCVAVSGLYDRGAPSPSHGAFTHLGDVHSHFLSVEVSASTAADESRTFSRSHAASLQFNSVHGSQKRSGGSRGGNPPQPISTSPDWSVADGELVTAVSPNGSLLMCVHSATQRAYFVALGHQQPFLEVNLSRVLGGGREAQHDSRTSSMRCLSVVWSPLGVAGGVYASFVLDGTGGIIWIGLDGECSMILSRDFLAGCSTPFAQDPQLLRCSHARDDTRLPPVLLCHSVCNKHGTVSLSMLTANFTSILTVCCTARLLKPQSVVNAVQSSAVVDSRIMSFLFFGCRASTTVCPRPRSSFAAILSKILTSLHCKRQLLLSGAVALANALAACINGVMVPPTAHCSDEVTSDFQDIFIWTPNILSGGSRQHSVGEEHHISKRVFATTLGEEVLLIIEHLLKPLIVCGAVSQVSEIVDCLNSTLLGGSRESLVLADYAALCCASSPSLGGFCFPTHKSAKSLPMFHKLQQQCTPEMQLMLSWPTFQSQRIEELTQVAPQKDNAPIVTAGAAEGPRAVAALEELFAAAVTSSSAPPVSSTTVPTRSYVSLPLTVAETEALIPFLLTRYGPNRVYECTVALLGRREDIVGCTPDVLERLNNLCQQLRGIM